MAEIIGTKGAELDLLIRQGATLGPFNTYVKKQDGSALNLTGATFTAQIRRTPESAPIPGATVSFTITDALNGVLSWSVPASSTAALRASEVDENAPESVYVWDMEVLLSDSRVLPLLYGTAKVFREVSKEEV